MQLDLLQMELLPTPQESPTVKFHPIKQESSIVALNVTENSLSSKPLPLSLQPQLIPVTIIENELGEELDIKHGAVLTEKAPKSPDAFKTISEAAKFLGVPQHVLRFWESRFAQIKPLKLGGGRRYYRPEDMEILSTIKNLLYKQGYTIKGAKKAFNLRKQSAGDTSIDIFTQTITPLPPVSQRILTEKQQNQLSGIRQELIGLRETLAIRL